MPKTMAKQYDDSHNLKIYCHEKSCLFGYEIELSPGMSSFHDNLLHQCSRPPVALLFPLLASFMMQLESRAMGT